MTEYPIMIGAVSDDGPLDLMRLTPGERQMLRTLYLKTVAHNPPRGRFFIAHVPSHAQIQAEIRRRQRAH